MIVWGGRDNYHPVLNTGGRYDPQTDSWNSTTTAGAPTARQGPIAVWTGSRMVVWAGWDGTCTNTGGVYDPAADSWKATTTAGAPPARYNFPTAVWTGSRMIVWGGSLCSDATTNTGGAYDPATDSWTPTSTAGAPAARRRHTAVWTGSRMIVWGGYFGYDSRSPLTNTGAIYDPATDSWIPTSTTGAPAGRLGHTAVWTGSRMIVWGGQLDTGVTDTGAVYDPATDSWTPMPAGATEVTARDRHTAVWTGSRMIVWGGWPDTGGVYDPVTQTWAATTTTGAPTGFWDHTAVWSGSAMIAWGGTDGRYPFDTGGVFSGPTLVPPLPTPAELYTVTPCRLVDTRNATGPVGGPALYPGATRAFPVALGACGVPSGATALSVNVTAVEPTKSGHLVLYRGDVTYPPGTSTLNFSSGVTRANNAVVLVSATAGTINVENRSTGSVHFVLDVNGYFR